MSRQLGSAPITRAEIATIRAAVAQCSRGMQVTAAQINAALDECEDRLRVCARGFLSSVIRGDRRARKRLVGAHVCADRGKSATAKMNGCHGNGR